MCKQSLAPQQFHWKYKSKRVRSSTCKACTAVRHRAWYVKNNKDRKKQIQVRNKEVALIARQYVFTYLSENPCVDCGEADPTTLEFDHRKGVDKVMCVSDMRRRRLSLDRIKAEIAKCDVRCANCHRRKTANDYNWYKSVN